MFQNTLYSSRTVQDPGCWLDMQYMGWTEQ